jgi:hypothetical protein
MSLGHPGFLADLYFARVNVYTGGLIRRPQGRSFDRRWAYAVMDLVVELDPQYYTAYLFSVMGLIHGPDDLPAARRIAEKGMAAFPDDWRIPFWLGYNYHLYRRDAETASSYMYLAAKKPGAPTYFLATLIKAQRRVGAYKQAAWAMSVMMKNAEKPEIKAIYAKKLARLQNLAALQEAARRFKAARGRWPKNLEELEKTGLITAPPPDPFGEPYTWNAEESRVVAGPVGE